MTDNTDFFAEKKEEEIEAPEETTETPEESTFTVGDDTYSQDELESLVGLGKMAREAEEKYNTPMDRVYPEYTKSRQQIKEMEAKLEAKVTTGEISQDEAGQALKAAEQIGLVTKDTFKNALKENFYEMYAEQRAADKLLETTSTMEKEFNGKDGRPKFRQREMLEYMRDTGINNPKLAYKAKYEKQIDAWKEKQLGSSGSRAETISSSTAGSKQPSPVSITNDNIDDLMREALKG